MTDVLNKKEILLTTGFITIDDIYSSGEIDHIVATIDNADKTKNNFRKSSDLFAIRQFLNEIPEVRELIFTDNFKTVIRKFIGPDFFVVKSIYFDKPATSNWYVSYHQDLTISVDKKLDLKHFGPWTVKQNQFAVQPPLDILENNYTVRIHLDHTDKNNGALKVIPKSHLKGIYRPETIDWTTATETNSEVLKGGLMIMKPLLLHSSGRTTNGKKRRVIHIELSNRELPAALQWSERLSLQMIVL